MVPEDIAHARELLGRVGYCSVELVEGVPNLYIKVRARAAGHVAEGGHRRASHERGVSRAGRRGAGRFARQRPREHASSRKTPHTPTLPSTPSLGLPSPATSRRRARRLSGRLSSTMPFRARGSRIPGVPRWDARLWRRAGEGVACRARARAAAPGSDARMSGCSTAGCHQPAGRVTRASPAAFPWSPMRRNWARITRSSCARSALSDLVAAHVKGYIGALSGVLRRGVRCLRRGRCHHVDARWHARADRRDHRQHARQRGRYRVATAPSPAARLRFLLLLIAANFGLRYGARGSRIPSGRGSGEGDSGEDHRKHGICGPAWV